jgi:hypothetical protein
LLCTYISEDHRITSLVLLPIHMDSVLSILKALISNAPTSHAFHQRTSCVLHIPALGMDLLPAHQGISPVITQICLLALLVKSVGRAVIVPLTATIAWTMRIKVDTLPLSLQQWLLKQMVYMIVKIG